MDVDHPRATAQSEWQNWKTYHTTEDMRLWIAVLEY